MCPDVFKSTSKGNKFNGSVFSEEVYNGLTALFGLRGQPSGFLGLARSLRVGMSQIGKQVCTAKLLKASLQTVGLAIEVYIAYLADAGI